MHTFKIIEIYVHLFVSVHRTLLHCISRSELCPEQAKCTFPKYATVKPKLGPINLATGWSVDGYLESIEPKHFPRWIFVIRFSLDHSEIEENDIGIHRLHYMRNGRKSTNHQSKHIFCGNWQKLAYSTTLGSLKSAVAALIYCGVGVNGGLIFFFSRASQSMSLNQTCDFISSIPRLPENQISYILRYTRV